MRASHHQGLHPASEGGSDDTTSDPKDEEAGNFGSNGPANDEVRKAPPYEKLAQKSPKPLDHPSITFGGPIIIFFDLVVPCIIYYTWFNINRSQWAGSCRAYTDRGQSCPLAKPEFNKDILGYSIISFGFGELYILIARVCRLLWHRDECAPLLSRSRWELDATSWVYAVAMLCALIPFVIGSTMVIPKLYLYSPAFIMYVNFKLQCEITLMLTHFVVGLFSAF